MVNKTESADVIRTVKAIKKLMRQEASRGKVGGYVDFPEDAVRKRGFFDTLKSRFTGEPSQPEIYRYGPIQLTTANDVSGYVSDSFKTVLTNMAIGLVLVVIMLTIFLNLRTAFWVAMGIPVAMTGVFFLMPFFGTFLDSISLASLVLVLGIIVDDGIIISENIMFRRHLGESPLDAAVNGVHEVFFPVLTTVLTTFLAFVPIFFIKGMLGKFIFVIPLTVSLALFISLFEAVFALPSHLKRGMEKRSMRAERATIGVWFEVLKKIYNRCALGFLRVRYLIFAIFIGVIFLALGYMQKNMDFILFPQRGAEQFWMLVELPMGSSLQATSEKVREIDDLIEEIPADELDNYVTRIGQIGWVGRAENYAQIVVNLTPFSTRSRTAGQIVGELREKTDKLEGYEKITYQIYAGGPPVGKAISLKILGHDDEKRRALADEVEAYLSTIDGVKDIDRDDKLGKDQIEIDLNYERLARVGLTVADVAQNVRIAYDGQVVTSLRDGDEDVDFRVQFTKQARQDERFLMNLSIPNVQNRLIKLRDVARLKIGPGPSTYRHFDGERVTTVEADVDTDVITSLDVNTMVVEQFDGYEERYPELRLRVGGEAQESQESIANIITTFIIAIVGIYFLLILLFNSFTQPLLVLIAIPFGFVGVIIALALHNEPLSFLALIGSVGLVGVVVNDSLVLVNHLNELRKQFPDMGRRELVAMGGSNRLRAIVLTTLTTVVGLLPLAYGWGGTSLYMSPMALTLGYGLLFATPVTLLLVPCLYMIFWDLERLFRRKKA